jgi:hypothetical protein
MRASGRVAILAALLGAAAGATELRVEVTYRSASTVYLGAGSVDGLAEGDRLAVVSDGVTIGEVEVVFLAEHSASCKVLRESRPIRPGDVAVGGTGSEPAPVAPPPAAAPAPPPASEPALGSRPVARVRGGVSLGWHRLWDETGLDYDFEQRTARIDLRVSEIDGRPLELRLRARTREDRRPRPPGFEGIPREERRDRLYELAVRYDPPEGRFSLELGRLGASTLGIGYLDGVLAELRVAGSARLGGFLGNRAGIDRTGFEGSGRKYGGYLRLGPEARGWPGRYEAIVFGVREKAGAEPSRDYVGVQGRLAARNLTLFQWAEVDLNGGWREAATGRTAQLSNLSLSARYRASSSASLGLSYDQRRNYRTADNRSIPDQLFDMFVRQGLRASVDLNPARGLGVSAFVGARFQDQARDSAYSFGGGVRHPDVLGWRASLDGSGFTNGRTQGLQASARIGRRVGSVGSADVAYGISSYTLTSTTEPRRLNQWLRLSGRGELGRGLTLYADLEYDTGDDVEGPRASLELAYRF